MIYELLAFLSFDEFFQGFCTDMHVFNHLQPYGIVIRQYPKVDKEGKHKILWK